MYSFFLSLHSITRWLVLISMVYAVVVAIRGLNGSLPFGAAADRARLMAVVITHIQASVGLFLYCISPIVRYFLTNFSEAVHERELRFFGMEHITVMLIAVTVITIGSVKIKREQDSRLKYKKMLIWFGLGLFLILTSVPWSFSPLTSRPDFRF